MELSQNAVYGVCIIAVLVHLIALPFFVWAMRRRQMRTSDAAMYALVLSDDAPDAAESLIPSLPTTPPAWKQRAMFGAIFAAFVVISWTFIQTVIASAGPPASLPAAGPATPPGKAAKCPF